MYSDKTYFNGINKNKNLDLSLKLLQLSILPHVYLVAAKVLLPNTVASP